MPTVIDSLVLVVGIDASKLTDQQRAAIDDLKKFEEGIMSHGRQVESQTKRVGDVLQNFKREAIATLGIFLGGRGIQEFTSFITTLDASTGRLSKTFGMNANEVSIWQGAIQQVGGTAGSATEALGGLNSALVKFDLAGEGGEWLGAFSQLGVRVYDDAGKLKTASQLIFDIADGIEKRHLDSRQAAGLLGLIPGMNQDMINLVLKGTGAMRGYLQAAKDAGGTTQESARSAEEYQRSLSLLDRSASNLGRTIVTSLTPALVSGLDAMRKFIQGPSSDAVRAAHVGKPDTFWEKLGSSMFAMPTLTGNRYSITPKGFAGRGATPEAGAALDRMGGKPAEPAPSGAATAAEREAYIRKAATARGIDPAVAVAVARSEGLGGSYVGDRGSSFGDFQLHYGGMAGGGMAVGGLGDKFTKTTGLDAKDPSTWRQQTDFALDEASRGGWGPWHGWKGLPLAGIGKPGAQAAASSGFFGAPASGIMPGAKDVTISIGQIQVNAPRATDGEGVAKEIGPHLDRVVNAASANW